MKYFTINELCASSTAKAKNINNTPSESIKAHLKEFVENLLDPIREELGYPIIVNSGYRCLALNKAVGGAPTSAHTIGYASDIHCKAESLAKMYSRILNFLTRNNIPYDQLIYERSKTSVWIHIGYKNQKGLQRKQHFNLNV